MAGLPKVFVVLLSTLAVTISLALAGVAQEITIDPVILPPEDVQTPSLVLQSVFDLIDANLAADPATQEGLKADIESAVDLGVLTPEQALTMLELVQWEALVDAEALANAAAAIQIILSDLVAGVLIDDPVVELTRLLNELATPAGTLTAISKAGASQEILDQVSSLAADGVPPGIPIQITKKGIRDGLSMEDIAAQLDALAAIIAAEDDVAWGQVANDILGKGENKYQDQEENANLGQNEEPEQEENEHGNGPSNNSGKKDDNPGKGKDK
jgi:hypothetical protein